MVGQHQSYVFAYDKERGYKTSSILTKGVTVMHLTKDKLILTNVRIKEKAGHFIGSLEFDGKTVFTHDRDVFTGYFVSEEQLRRKYPNSLSYDEALKKAQAHNMYSPTL